MPHLMVNLEDVADCEKAMMILNRRLNRDCGPDGRGPRNGPGNGPGGRHRRGRHGRQDHEGRPRRGGPREDVSSLPLPQKLKRIQSRGMWKHLLKIAQSAEKPLSLSELDELLDLPKNKMRSLKAIMAKLELSLIHI